MADDQPQPQSIAARIAALKLSQEDHQVPSETPPNYNQAVAGRRKPPLPPSRPTVPARPGIHARTQSSNNPPVQDYPTVTTSHVGNLPEAGPPDASSYGMDGISRPALPSRTSTQSITSPALPPRRPSDSPALPARRPSEAPSIDSRRVSNYSLSRQASNDSMSSIATARSGVSAVSNGTSYSSQSVKAPAYDPSSLPPLPPKRTQEEKVADHKKYNGAMAGKRFPLKTVKSSPNVQPEQVGTTPPPPTPARQTVVPPPSLPSRPRPDAVVDEPLRIEPPPRQKTEPSPPSLPSKARPEPVEKEVPRIEPPPRQRTEPPPPRKSALSHGFNHSTNVAPPVPIGRPGSVPQLNGAAPPPVPAASKPDLAALQASKPKSNGATTPQSAAAPAGTCMHCRDFSAPDNHAARFPRESLPSQDIGWLAQQLTAPFPSLTDKARALFTWLHHNVAYDTVAFFNDNVKSSTPQATLQSGLAVCEGYAGLFAALAIKVGLEALVVSGHGKGYGHSALKPGDPLPPYSAGHAWSAVKIDGGQWKLIDCCWGAGNVNGKDQPYNKSFSPERFTQSNDDFGLDHFPGDSSKQFRNDGRVMTWEEYILGNKRGSGAHFFSGFVAEEGLSKPSFQPATEKIHLCQLPGPTVRFSFQKICPHWDPIRNGKGPYYIYVLACDAMERHPGKNHTPFETNGTVWWCDVPVEYLGGPGSKVQINVMKTFDGQDGRGLSIQRYRERIGKCGWGGGGVCMWQVA